MKFVNLAARHDRWMEARGRFEQEMIANFEGLNDLADALESFVSNELFRNIMSSCRLRIIGNVPDGSIDWTELEQMLQDMDWTFAMSDDHGVYVRGAAAMDLMMDCMALAYRISPSWTELMWDNYAPPSFHRPLSSAGMFRTRMTAILDGMKEKNDAK